MPAPKRVSDEAIRVAFWKHGSVWKAGEELGICGQNVHERLIRLGLNKPMNIWRSEDDAILQDQYLAFRDAGKLGVLAERLGRTKHFLCRQAKRLGLTNHKHPRPYVAKWKYMDEAVATGLMDQFKRSRLGLGQYCAKRGFDPVGFSRTMKRFFADEWEHVIEAKAPRQGMYRLGRAVEYRFRDALRSLGYFVMRSPASKTAVDLVAIKPGVVLFVSCKRSGVLAPAEWNTFYDLAISCGAVPLLGSQEDGRLLRYRRLTGRKVGGSDRGRQPFQDYTPEPRLT